MRIILDTQIISYAIKGKSKEPLPEAFSITSTVAQELLRVRDIPSGGARYFTPPPQRIAPEQKGAYLRGGPVHRTGYPSNRPRFRNSTDRIVMDFANEYPAVVEYGHLGISWLIRTGNRRVYEESITHLPKDERKKLVGNFEFISHHVEDCVPVNSDIISGAFSLLKQVTDEGVAIKADFRNTLNDMPILSTARHERAKIQTEDKLMAQFAKKFSIFGVKESGDHYELICSDPEPRRKRDSHESKGYRNTGWRFAIHRNPSAR
ncbi:hypothetical protein [Streptomyces sp. NPDC005828]|uniref:hypothetical protein n=1 Tax=Streptomyces sp. NPDC005828 TaxID=3157071 RepID=UPI00340B56FD